MSPMGPAKDCPPRAFGMWVVLGLALGAGGCAQLRAVRPSDKTASTVHSYPPANQYALEHGWQPAQKDSVAQKDSAWSAHTPINRLAKWLRGGSAAPEPGLIDVAEPKPA